MLKVHLYGKITEKQLLLLKKFLDMIEEFDSDFEFKIINEYGNTDIQNTQHERESYAFELLKKGIAYAKVKDQLKEKFKIGISDRTLSRIKKQIESNKAKLFLCASCHHEFAGEYFLNEKKEMICKKCKK